MNRRENICSVYLSITGSFIQLFTFSNALYSYGNEALAKAMHGVEQAQRMLPLPAVLWPAVSPDSSLCHPSCLPCKVHAVLQNLSPAWFHLQSYRNQNSDFLRRKTSSLPPRTFTKGKLQRVMRVILSADENMVATIMNLNSSAFWAACCFFLRVIIIKHHH